MTDVSGLPRTRAADVRDPGSVVVSSTARMKAPYRVAA